MSLEKSNVLHFPSNRVMSVRVAEMRMGNLRNFKCPNVEDPCKWMEEFLIGKAVLIGWQSIKEGIVKSFKNGRVKHLVSGVTIPGADGGARPKINVLCSSQRYPVFNWVGEPSVSKTPVAILTMDQEIHFRLCDRCQAVLEKQRKDEILAGHKRVLR